MRTLFLLFLVSLLMITTNYIHSSTNQPDSNFITNTHGNDNIIIPQYGQYQNYDRILYLSYLFYMDMIFHTGFNTMIMDRFNQKVNYMMFNLLKIGFDWYITKNIGFGTSCSMGNTSISTSAKKHLNILDDFAVDLMFLWRENIIFSKIGALYLKLYAGTSLSSVNYDKGFTDFVGRDDEYYGYSMSWPSNMFCPGVITGVGLHWQHLYHFEIGIDLFYRYMYGIKYPNDNRIYDLMFLGISVEMGFCF